MKHLLTTLLTLSLAGCASQELRNKGVPDDKTKDSGLIVSSEILFDLSDTYNVFIQINLQNKTGKYVRIDSADLDLTNVTQSPYNIIVGNDLSAWLNAKEEEQRIRGYNQNAALLGIYTAGTALTVGGVSSRNEPLTAIGATAMAGSLAYGTVQNINNQRDFVQQPKKVPETHLYTPFTVPSMSLSKRWILVNIPNGRIARRGKLNLKTVEGETYSYIIPIVEDL
ncbi:MAG: hypothetical protein ACXWRE_06865 [Pseudobdellovibrionaceae bacterium]